MNKHKAEVIIFRLLDIAAEVRYGSVSVSIKMHDKRIVEVTYSTSEQYKVPKELLNKETLII